MNKQFFLYAWNGESGSIVSRGYKLNLKDKLELSFPYDTIYYEPEVNNKMKIIGEKIFKLTDSEIQEIQKKCEKFLETGDYIVQAYDPSTGLFEGEMYRSEAKQKRFKFRIFESPEHPVSKWVDGKGWVRIAASIMENGTVNLNPGSICPKCVLLLTEEEWNNFPERPNDFFVWDFVESSWKDPRKFEDLKSNAYVDIRHMFESIRWKADGGFIPQYEQQTWMDQYNEAKTWLVNKNAETPYIDAFLNNRTDEYIPEKSEYCKEVVEKHKKFLVSMAKINASQWSFLKKLEHAKDNDEIDKIKNEATTKMNELISSFS